MRALHIWFYLSQFGLNPYIFSAILPIYFFGYFTHIFFRLFYPYIFVVKPHSCENIPSFPHSCENIPQFPHRCENIPKFPLRRFRCLFLLVRLYTEIPWDYTETFWVPIFTGAAIHRWSFFFRFFPRFFSFFFFTFFWFEPTVTIFKIRVSLCYALLVHRNRRQLYNSLSLKRS